ncbi:MAG TPA: GTP cyclohydrolase I [Candidatus Polarisedimenticolia bacterium]|nr:GTP cyclohydrolase I [Candidatus Polarisedimenticolia bacterium]
MKKARRPRPTGRPDRVRLRAAARRFLEAIGEPELRRDQARTPQRVADAWAGEILSGYAADPRRILGAGFPARDRDLVVVKDIPFVSVCVHHLLPFAGTAHVGYLPAKRLAGLSKIARVVDVLSRRLQLQERLTRQVTAALMEGLAPLGAACRMEAEHQCMTIRGARKRGTRVVTTAYEGAFRARPALRAEFLRLSSSAADHGRGRR